MGLWAFVVYIPSLLRIGHCLGMGFPLCTWPMSFYLMFCGLAGASAMPLHCSCYNITYPFTLFLLLGLRAEASTMSISYIIPSFGFTAQHSCWANPFRTLGFLGSFHSLGVLGPFHPSLPLTLLWVFWLNPLGFLEPITISLPFALIGLWPHEFTNSFL